MDRRSAIKWMLTASASLAAGGHLLNAASSGHPTQSIPAARGYGPDPSMVKIYKAGEVWPLTLTAAQRRTAAALCDVIIPADETSPSASAVGVTDFIDEWVSAPYPMQQDDRPVVLEGLAWLDGESQSRFGAPFADLKLPQQTALCDEICDPARAKPGQAAATKFFHRYRDLTSGGYYTTPEGMQAIGYIGNTPLASFEGPSPEALRHLGLA
jgi:hypothetical protein